MILYHVTENFRVRVRHYSGCKYTVDYAYYRFFPVWHHLQFWFSQGHPGGTECWSTNLCDFDEAESITTGLKCIEDVEKYYKPFQEEKLKWEQDEEKFWKENHPYSSKEF